MSSSERIYPLRKPKNHTPPIPRWQLVLRSDISHVCTAYIGIQQHSTTDESSTARLIAIKAVQSWLDDKHSPDASECFTLLEGNDAKNVTIWVCYWKEQGDCDRSISQLNLSLIYSSMSDVGRKSIGIWLERFSTAKSRLETNYSGLDYLPGLARLPDTRTDEHSLSAYWGAARDRIPDSASDLFQEAETRPLQTVPKGLGQHLVGTNFTNMVHIRSGQFWKNCSEKESASYEENLEPTLRNGLQYLWDNPLESGAMGVRYLLNQDLHSADSDFSRKESCVAGFFTSLKSLETWAKTHRSHLAIYRGALAHAKVFGQERKFRTWHEVSVLKDGEASFQYINCLPETGVIRFISLTKTDLR